MKASTFAERTRDPGAYRILRRLTIAVIVVWFPLALWSGFRAIVQVFRLELSPPAALAEGAVVRADVVTSGRAHCDLTIELVQGARRVTVGHVFVAGNRDGALDPRPRRGSLTVALAPEHARGWTDGPVTLRATAIGRGQWMRVPPPTIREVVIPR